MNGFCKLSCKPEYGADAKPLKRVGGLTGNRTRVHGFAGHCGSTPFNDLAANCAVSTRQQINDLARACKLKFADRGRLAPAGCRAPAAERTVDGQSGCRAGRAGGATDSRRTVRSANVRHFNGLIFNNKLSAERTDGQFSGGGAHVRRARHAGACALPGARSVRVSVFAPCVEGDV